MSILVASLLLFSCGGEKKEEVNAVANQVVENTIEEQVEEAKPVVSHAEWSAFFADFRSAVEAGDKEKIKSMSSEKHLEPADFFSQDEYGWSFEGAAKKKFLEQTADKAKKMTSGPKDELASAGITDLLELPVHDKAREFSIYYYFGKIEGNYKLVSILKAG